MKSISRPLRARHALLGWLAGAWLAGAPAAQAAEAMPPAATAPVPFDHYQTWRDEPLQNWREVNDRVGEIGGWRAYIREAQEEGGMQDGRHDHHGH